jgi:hypothetical protein
MKYGSSINVRVGDTTARRIRLGFFAMDWPSPWEFRMLLCCFDAVSRDSRPAKTAESLARQTVNVK